MFMWENALQKCYINWKGYEMDPKYKKMHFLDSYWTKLYFNGVWCTIATNEMNIKQMNSRKRAFRMSETNKKFYGHFLRFKSIDIDIKMQLKCFKFIADSTIWLNCKFIGVIYGSNFESSPII